MPAVVDIFQVVREKAASKIESQKIASTLLLAVEDVIKSQKANLVPAAYYASLMSLLQNFLDDTQNSQQEVIAISHLLSLLFPELPQQILKNHFSEIASTLTQLSQSFNSPRSAALDRYMLVCLAHLISSQDGSSWSASDINALFQLVLTFAVDDRPKVRKAASSSIAHILARPPAPLVYHPASTSIIRLIQQSVKRQNEDNNPLIHSLSILSGCWSSVSPSQIESLSETLVNVVVAKMDVLNSNVLKAILECLEDLADYLCLSGNWSASKNSNFLQAILKVHPNINDSSSFASWLALIRSTCKSLSVSSPESFGTLLPVGYAQVFSFFQFTPHKEELTAPAHDAIGETLNILLDLITADMILESVSVAKTADESRETLSAVELIIMQTEKGLTLPFQSGWGTIMSVIAHLIANVGQYRLEIPTVHTLLSNLYETLAEDEVYASNPHFAHMSQFHSIIGAAIEAIGPALFLQYFSLNLELEKGSRAWVLPLLQDHVSNAELKFFIDYFVPLSFKVAQRGQSCIADGRTIEGKACAVVWRQIWDMLPAFCRAPTDCQGAFVPLCELIVPFLMANDDRIVSICDSFRILVNSNVQIARGRTASVMLTAEQASENVDFLAKYSSELLPQFFTKYVSLFSGDKAESANSQQLKTCIMESIKTWITISLSESVNSFFQTVVKKYLQLLRASKTAGDAELSHQKHAIFDLANVMIPSAKLEPEALQVFFKVIMMEIRSEDATIQKKSFKALTHTLKACSVPEEVESIFEPLDAIESRCENVASIFSKNTQAMDDICKVLIDTTLTTEVAAKKARLKLLSHVVGILDWKSVIQMELIPSTISEAILSTKEVSDKARALSYDLLIAMARRYIALQEESNGEARIVIPAGDEAGEGEISLSINLEEFFKMVFAGFAGKTPLMISTTVHALSRLLFEFKCDPAHLSPDFIKNIVHSVILSSEHTKTREVIRATIGLLKVVVVTCPDILFSVEMENSMGDIEDYANYNFLKGILELILKWSDEHKSHFRVQCRHIIERIIRKCGLQRVEYYFPESQKKLLNNIRKRKERAARNRAAGKAEAREAAAQPIAASYEELMKEDDNDSEDDLPTVMKELVKSQPKLLKPSLRLAENGNDQPLDLLDQRMATTSLMQKSKQKRKTDKKVSFAEEDGKMVINESDDDGDMELLKGNRDDYMESINSNDQMKRSADGKRIKFSNKRSRDDDYEDDEDAPVPKYQVKRPANKRGGSEAPRRNSRALKTSEKEMANAGIAHTGKEYRNSKARGDIKKEGKPDPFAYIPLNPKIVGSNNGHKKGIHLNKKLFTK